MLKRNWESIKLATALMLVAVIVGGFAYGIVGGIVNWYVYRNEPIYLVSRAYDPIWQRSGYVPKDTFCFSPVRCEPSGKPKLQYFTLLGEHELRQWGLDPANETPVTSDPFY